MPGEFRVKSAATNGVSDSVMRASLADGDDARTAQVVAAMWAMVDASDFSQDVTNVAKRLGWTSQRKDYRQQLRNIFAYIRSERFRFRRDAWGKEVVGDPTQLLREVERPGGYTSVDCDDIATLGASLVKSMGWKPILITTAKTQGGPWGHVFFGAVVDGRDVPMDPQEASMPFVWTRRPGVDRVGVWEYHAADPNTPRTPRI